MGPGPAPARGSRPCGVPGVPMLLFPCAGRPLQAVRWRPVSRCPHKFWPLREPVATRLANDRVHHVLAVHAGTRSSRCLRRRSRWRRGCCRCCCWAGSGPAPAPTLRAADGKGRGCPGAGPCAAPGAGAERSLPLQAGGHGAGGTALHRGASRCLPHLLPLPAAVRGTWHGPGSRRTETGAGGQSSAPGGLTGSGGGNWGADPGVREENLGEDGRDRSRCSGGGLEPISMLLGGSVLVPVSRDGSGLVPVSRDGLGLVPLSRDGSVLVPLSRDGSLLVPLSRGGSGLVPVLDRAGPRWMPPPGSPFPGR